jgi:hypothetical protein
MLVDGDRLISRHFHDVAIAPRLEEFKDETVLHIGLGVKNGSVLELPLKINQISARLNEQPLEPIPYQRIHSKILALHKEQLDALAAQEDRLGASYKHAFGMNDSIGDRNDSDPVSYGMALEKQQRGNERKTRELEEATKRKLKALEEFYVHGVEIGGGQRYETFFDLPLPRNLEPGDVLAIKLLLPPDLHEFKLEASKK